MRAQSNQVQLTVPAIEAAAREQPLLKGLLASGAGFSAESAGCPQPSQSKREALLLFCVKGVGWSECAGRLHTLRKGDLLVLPVGSHRVCRTQASNPWTIHWVQATGALLPHYLEKLAVGERGTVLHVGEDQQLTRLYNQILRALQRGPSFAQLLEASHALGCLMALLIQKRQDSSTENSDTVQKVAEAIIYMSEHLKEPLRVSSLARSASLSPAYFSQLFKEQTGCSPRDYLHLLRIHRACELLHATGLNVKQIALQVGYQDPFHFSRQFKAFQGLSPTEYRDSRL